MRRLTTAGRLVDTMTASTDGGQRYKRFTAHLLDKKIFALTQELTHYAISTAHIRSDIDEFAKRAKTVSIETGRLGHIEDILHTARLTRKEQLISLV